MPNHTAKQAKEKKLLAPNAMCFSERLFGDCCTETFTDFLEGISQTIFSIFHVYGFGHSVG
jgi:hypothetical protein